MYGSLVNITELSTSCVYYQSLNIADDKQMISVHSSHYFVGINAKIIIMYWKHTIFALNQSKTVMQHRGNGNFQLPC